MTSKPTGGAGDGWGKSHLSITRIAASDFRWIVFGAISMAAHAVVLGLPQFSLSSDARLGGGFPATVRLATTPSGSVSLPKPAPIDTLAETLDNPSAAPGSPFLDPGATRVAGEYLFASQLDQRPKPLAFFDFVNISLPDDSTGTVVVQLWINESGHVDLIEIEDSTLDKSFAQELVKQRRSLLFQPGEVAGAPARAIVRYEFNVAPAVLQPRSPRMLNTNNA